MKKIINSFVGYLNVSPALISEAETKGTNTITVQGVLQRANAENQNERIYPKEILEREVVSFQNKIKQRMNGGELDHPDNPVVNLKNISHVIKEIWWDGDDVKGKIEILNTPSGNIAKELIRGGIQLGISSRGMGSTENKEGKTTVSEDFELITWDLVSNPSTIGAFVNPINESLNNKVVKQRQEIDNIVMDMLNLEL